MTISEPTATDPTVTDPTVTDPTDTDPAENGEVHPAWLPPSAFRALGSRRVLVRGDGQLTETVARETEAACARYGGSVRYERGRAGSGRNGSRTGTGTGIGANDGDNQAYDVILTLTAEARAGTLGDEGFALSRRDGVTLVAADRRAGLLYGLFHLVRLGESAFEGAFAAQRHLPAASLRMLDHWDNVDVHPVMGQVERGYAGGSLFWDDGALRENLDRVRQYARLLAACGINAITVNNVNVHATETHLLTDRLGDVTALADVLRPYGIRVHLSVNFASPLVLGALPTADPLDERVRDWWAETTARVYASIPDFGGYVVKADSEGQPGPFAYRRSHADGANLLADALAPFGGVVHWRAFVYNHRQDWRDRSTDRARAAYDHFAPLDGRLRRNAILQAKYGPMDFQAREPLSPVIAAMPSTRVAVEFQVTQEYTGQQRHVCYLGPQWSELLGFRPRGEQGGTVAAIAAESGGGLVAVSNAGTDRFWTGHPLAQANLYAFGRLAWDPALDPIAVLDEWIGLTFQPVPLQPEPFQPVTGRPREDERGRRLRAVLHDIMDDSWRVYEQYTAPLGVGFMVRPGNHYGPDVDGYEYTPWGTYHFADRDGVGVDRTRASGTGFTGQYPRPWSDRYESLDQCPDELLLFFHHVPYTHVLRSGSTVIQHIYDSHFAGARRVARMRKTWSRIGAEGLVEADLHARVLELLDEQERCAREWCDQINTYFFRKSGIPDERGEQDGERRIY